MPPLVIDVRSAEEPRDVVHRAVQALVEGKLVILPTETVYGLAASAVDERAINRLLAVKHRLAGKSLALAIKGADDALDYVPGLSPLARRLARRCWPGPVTMVVEDEHPDSLLRQLPLQAQQAICPTGTVGFRVPAHQTVLDILRMIAGPIVLTSANRSGYPDPVTAEDAMSGLDSDVDLVLNDGQSRLGQPSTVVKVSHNKLQVLRAGVVPEPTLRRLSSLMVLFVCTGNTCRSPMAEVMFRKLVADKLGCGVDQVHERGVLVMSAGTSAMMGGRPSQEAVQVMSQMSLNLADHESQPITAQLVKHADHIFTMTRGHRQAIINEWPEAAARTVVLCRDEGDVADPIGGPAVMYQQCAEQIKAELEGRLEEMEL